MRLPPTSVQGGSTADNGSMLTFLQAAAERLLQSCEQYESALEPLLANPPSVEALAFADTVRVILDSAWGGAIGRCVSTCTAALYCIVLHCTLCGAR